MRIIIEIDDEPKVARSVHPNVTTASSPQLPAAVTVPTYVMVQTEGREVEATIETTNWGPAPTQLETSDVSQPSVPAASMSTPTSARVHVDVDLGQAPIRVP